MNVFRSRFLAVAVLLSAVGAHAQLKLPPSVSSPAPAASTQGAAAPSAGPTASSESTSDKEAAAQLAASGWLVLLDRRDWGRAWESTSGVFRSTVPLAAWMDGIPKARDPLGAYVERSADEAIYRNALEGRPAGDYVTVIYSTKFAAKPDTKEVITLVREPDGRWRVTGYSTR